MQKLLNPKCKGFSKTWTRYIHSTFSFSKIHAKDPSTNSLNPKLLLYQLPQHSGPWQISFLRPTAKTPYPPYPQIPQSKPTIHTIPTNQQRSPSSKMQTTNHHRDLLPQTHDRASKESKPTIPTIPTNQHISPSSNPWQRPLP